MPFFGEDIRSPFKLRFNFIKVRQEGHVFRLTLARPEKRNAFTPVMICEIAYALQFANASSEVRAVVIDAEGPVFCAGMDLNVFNDPELDTHNPDVPFVDIPLAEAIAQLDKPSVAVAEGAVIAGGFLIVGECTFVVAGRHASFSLPEVKRGIFPMQVMSTLSKILPQRKILEMSILAKSYLAEEALEMGLVTEVSDHPREAAETLLGQILENAPYAISRGMAALKSLQEIPRSEYQRFLKARLEEIRSSEDAKIGYEAFKSRSKPAWKNK